MEFVVIVLAVALAGCVGLCFWLLRSRPDSRRLEMERALAEDRLEHAKREYASGLQAADRRMDELKDGYERRLAELKEAHSRQLEMLKEEYRRQAESEREAMGERFKAMASDILQANSRQLDLRNRQSLEAALSPMKTSLEEFTKGYRECYDIENRDRLSLREEIRSLHELNTRVEHEAGKLATALKGNTSVQGRWGEMMLTNILEHSGLQQGRWFVTQESTTAEDGSRLRPDAVIHCPKQRDIIIDSKVSLTYYLRMLEADSEGQRSAMAKAHLQSVEAHIKELRDKEYQNRIGAKKGDFVLMFMPHEGAYIEAMNANPDLWQKAYDGHVIIVSPTHLVTVVRLVEQMWQIEDQTVNSEKIANTAQAMIESVTAFLKDMSAVGDSIEKVQAAYDSAVKRLKSGNNNVLRVAARLDSLGIKAKKAVPERFAEHEE